MNSEPFGVEVQILKELKENVHVHPEIEILYVLEGGIIAEPGAGKRSSW